MSDKGIITKIHDQLRAAESVGQLACAFSIEDTKAILELIEQLREENERINATADLLARQK